MNFPKTNNAFDWVAAYQKEYPESQWGCGGHLIEWFAAALYQGYEQCKKDNLHELKKKIDRLVNFPIEIKEPFDTVPVTL